MNIQTTEVGGIIRWEALLDYLPLPKKQGLKGKHCQGRQLNYTLQVGRHRHEAIRNITEFANIEYV